MSRSSTVKKKLTGTSKNWARLRNYQKVTVRDMVQNPNRGVFLAPGLGKTLCTLEAFYTLKKRRVVNSMLVVAPLRPARKVWAKEAKKWEYDFSTVLLHGKGKQELEYEHDIYVINYEGLPWLFDQFVKHPELAPDMLVLDESTKIKNARSKRFKLLRAMRMLFSRHYILTGGPAPNGYMDLWSQIYMLDEGEILGRYLTHYRHRWFIQTGYGGYTYVLAQGAEEEIKKAIAPLITHFGKSALKLPPIHPNEIIVDLPEEAMRIYKEFEQQMLIEVNDTVITAASAGVLTQKLRQVSNGAIYTGRGKEYELLHDTKIDALLDLLDEINEPALIGYEFQHDLHRLETALRKEKIRYKHVDDKNAEEDWNEGKLQALLGQTAATAHGLNFQYGGRHIILFGLTWSLENFEQFYQRVWRQGQKETTFLHKIVADETVDLVMSDVLGKKDVRQKHLLAAFEKYTKSRSY